MTPEEARRQFEEAGVSAAEALAAAAADPSALAPEVIGLMQKAAAGVRLIIREENLVFFGVRALAAAGDRNLYAALTALLILPEQQLDRLLGVNVVGLLLAAYDGNPEPLFAAVENSDVPGRTKLRLFRVLARLTFDGRISRERMIDLLERFDRNDMAPSGDAAWEGWLDAIVYLGLRQFEQRALTMGRGALVREEMRREFLSRLEYAAAHPDDPQRFDDGGLRALTDPADGLIWEPEAEEAQDPDADEREDPAADIALSEDELDWLGEFLVSPQAPALTMNLETLDGFFTGLVIGPEEIGPAEFLPLIWGGAGEGPQFDSLEQGKFVTGLLVRHRSAMVKRFEAGCLPEPVLLDRAPEEEACDWVAGFVRAMILRVDSWAPVVRDRNAGPVFMSILALIGYEYDADFKEPTPEQRKGVIDLLPLALMSIYLFWCDHAGRSVLSEPARSTKVGRNQPCPCGSGQKYKRCCGANAGGLKVA
jgi:uncharacterized protein